MGALEDTVTQMTEPEWLALGCSACCHTNAPTGMLLWHKMHVASFGQGAGMSFNHKGNRTDVTEHFCNVNAWACPWNLSKLFKKKINQRVLCKTRFFKCSGKRTARGHCWMNNGRTLNAALSLIFLPFSLSGYETSGSGVGDAARWESRHLLQEAFDTEIQVYMEPEKNCTEPGKTGGVLWAECLIRCPSLLYLPACYEGPEWFGCQPSSAVMSCVHLLDFDTCGTSFQTGDAQFSLFQFVERIKCLWVHWEQGNYFIF